MKTLRILANDGIGAEGKQILEDAGHFVSTEKVAQEDLVQALQDYDVLLVRSATQVRQDLISRCPHLKMIGRGGVGMDNIDVQFARESGIHVFNTPASSSQAVAELAFGHLLTLSRSLHLSNRNLADGNFNNLKKAFSQGHELAGKTIGIIGFGRIGICLARLAMGAQMKVIMHDPYVPNAIIHFEFQGGAHTSVKVESIPFEEVLQQADVISFHLPYKGEQALVGRHEIGMMKSGVILLNTARGDVFDEDALLEALNDGKVGGAGLDVFRKEPHIRTAFLLHPRVSHTPHIGASTLEAQTKISIELAQEILRHAGE